jgi:hypothetical protein
MKPLLEVRGLTVKLPTELGWMSPVDDVSLRDAAGCGASGDWPCFSLRTIGAS